MPHRTDTSDIVKEVWTRLGRALVTVGGAVNVLYPTTLGVPLHRENLSCLLPDTEDEKQPKLVPIATERLR